MKLVYVWQILAISSVAMAQTPVMTWDFETIKDGKAIESSTNIADTIEGNFEEASGRVAMKQLLSLNIPFTGVVCANDEMAAGAMDTARKQAIKVPDDISVIGYDNVSFTHYLHPKLSSIGCRISEMGQMAARCVLKYAYGQTDLDIQNTFKPRLVLRDSVKSR